MQQVKRKAISPRCMFATNLMQKKALAIAEVYGVATMPANK